MQQHTLRFSKIPDTIKFIFTSTLTIEHFTSTYRPPLLHIWCARDVGLRCSDITDNANQSWMGGSRGRIDWVSRGIQFEFTSTSSGSHFGSPSTSFRLRSISHQLSFDVTSISFRANCMCTSDPIRFHLELASVSRQLPGRRFGVTSM